MSIRGSLAVLVIATLMAGAVFSVIVTGAEGERSVGAALHLFGAQDFTWLCLAVVFFVSAWAISRHDWPVPVPVARPVAVLTIAVLVFVAVLVGRVAIHHGFGLSMDEFMMIWQSEVILAGHLLAPAPDVWWPYSVALRPGFLLVDPALHIWSPPYRPGTALLHALFVKLSLGGAMNATFCAGSVIVLWRLARRLLPRDTGAVICAVLLVALSPQFLITGGTPYTMTAHLFASLLWIWLFTIDRGWSHVAAIALGCYALGLHHVHVHIGLAMPFLLHLLVVRRRWLLSLTYGLTYGAAVVAWIFWMDIAAWATAVSPVAPVETPAVDGDLGLVRMAVSQGVSAHGWTDLALWGANFSRLIAWQNLAMLPLILVALGQMREMPTVLRLMAWSVLTSLLPYILLMPSQGHGWGYRYLHHELGTLSLVAAFGWSRLRAAGRERMLRFAVILGVVSAVVGLPLRAIQVENFVRPFWAATQYLKARDADVVLVATEGIWYGRDLIRNDPLIRNRPAVMALEVIPDPALVALCKGRKIRFVAAEELAGLGIQRRAETTEARTAREAGDRLRLDNAGCMP